jgi:pSer/pThr/pTyr-binding forkhead associated (FHA) protein
MRHWLVMQASDGTQRPFELSKARIVIGREATCDVRVPLSSVAQKHCQITREDDGALRIRHLAAPNGTYHNGRPLEQEAALSHGDKLVIGPVTFIVRIAHGDDGDNVAGQEIVIEREP